MNIQILSALLIAFTVAGSVDLLATEELTDEWNSYKVMYNKRYVDLEEYSRRLIWEQNIKYIQKHNIRYNLGEFSYYLGINQFTDMSHKEFKEKYLRLRSNIHRSGNVAFMPPLNIKSLPNSVNWTSKGYVTPVKNQGQCGSCWTFSTTGSLEGQYFRKYKTLESFSEQQIVDCSRAFGPQGCGGGWMDDAMRYIKQFGIERETDYPYFAKEGTCKYNRTKVVTRISGIVDIATNNEAALAAAVATQGPVSVAIDASHPSFQSYRGGVYDQRVCSTIDLDHAVLVAGYGVTSDGKRYWQVKNSWGPSWGLGGYILMSKDKNNQCGIASKASFPIM